MRELQEKIRAAERDLQRRLDTELLRAGQILAGQASREARAGRPGLKVDTGRLSQSILAHRDGPGRVAVGTRVEYARIHELGGVTAPHVIEARRKQALAFQGADGQVVVKRVNHPGSRIPARPFMRPALEKTRNTIIAIIRQVYAGPLKLGRTIVG